MELAGRIAIVTGGSRGLGKALAEALRTAGATVVTCSLSPKDLENHYAVDVSKPEAVESFVDAVLQEYGHIDILINNAGYCPKPCFLEELSVEEYEKCMHTNLDGAFYMMKYVLPHMKKQNEGLIVNVSSRAGKRAHPTLASYSSSKSALDGLTQALSKELQEAESAVTCFSVSPGGINTDMREYLFGEENSRSQQGPELVAEFVLKMMTGDIDVPSGGDAMIVHGEVTDITPAT